jgi:hypothetical protein
MLYEWAYIEITDVGKGKSKVVPVKVYWGNGGIAPGILTSELDGGE